MGFVLDEAVALQLLITIPLSPHVYGFSPLLFILCFPSSIFHIRDSNYQLLYPLHLKFAFFSPDHKSNKCLLLKILKIQKV